MLTDSTSVEATVPRVFLLDGQALSTIKQQVHTDHFVLHSAYKKLLRDAEKALTFSPVSVVQKAGAPPDGDRHQYMSLSRYWWPNPDTQHGLPYIRRDGEVNPEIHAYPDAENLSKMTFTGETLALAYYFAGNEIYAAHATRLFRTWFLDQSTQMSPNLNHAQFVPGIKNGRGAGILDGRHFARIIDAIGLLAGSSAWTEQDQQGMHHWFAQYLPWVCSSPQGRAEAQTSNNHASWYHMQVTSVALFLGDTALATHMIQNTQRLIANQIAPDGRQPQELERTRSWDYSLFNLQALFALATLGTQVGIELWHFETQDGRSLQKALDYLVRFALGQQVWTERQINPPDATRLPPLLRQAAAVYASSHYLSVCNQLAGAKASMLREHLIYPPPPSF